MIWKCRYDITLKTANSVVKTMTVDYWVYPSGSGGWYADGNYYNQVQTTVLPTSKPQHEYTYREVLELANTALTSSVLPTIFPNYENYRTVFSGSYAETNFTSASGGNLHSFWPGGKCGWYNPLLISGSS